MVLLDAILIFVLLSFITVMVFIKATEPKFLVGDAGITYSVNNLDLLSITAPVSVTMEPAPCFSVIPTTGRYQVRLTTYLIVETYMATDMTVDYEVTDTHTGKTTKGEMFAVLINGTVIL